MPEIYIVNQQQRSRYLSKMAIPLFIINHISNIYYIKKCKVDFDYKYFYLCVYFPLKSLLYVTQVANEINKDQKNILKFVVDLKNWQAIIRAVKSD